MVMHMNVCGYLSSGANYLSLWFLRQSLSVACNSPSNLGLMVSEPPNVISASPALDLQEDAIMLDFLHVDGRD